MLKIFALVPLFTALTALTATPVLAKPVVIAELGSAPLLGTSRSTAEMRARVAANGAFVSQAAQKLGLTSAQYAQFSSAIASSHVAWVTVPRHLDAMTWRSGSNVYVLRNVMIPAKTNGWQVDLNDAHERISIYMPAACGNVSIVRTMLPAVAQRARVRPAPVVAVVPPPAVAPPVEEAAVMVPDDSVKPAAATVAENEFPPAAAAKRRGSPLFLAPLLFGLAALSGGSGSGPIAVLPDGCP